MAQNTKETVLNFGGFYESIHSQLIDDRIECDSDVNEDDNIEIDYCEIDYKTIHTDYSKEYVNVFNKQFDTKFEFIGLYSPKQYNYTTDRIDIKYSISDVKTLLKGIDKDELIEYINEKTKSYDGFISYYANFDAVKKDLDIFMQFLIDYYYEYVEDINDDYEALIDIVDDLNIDLSTAIKEIEA